MRATARPLGSNLIGQPFDDPKYFWSRPSATSPQPYNAAASSGSNQGPRNPALADAVKDRIKALRDADPDNKAPVPVDLVTASGSGLDPDISVAAAEYQLARVAKARGMPADKVRALVAESTTGSHLRNSRRTPRQRAQSSTSRSIVRDVDVADVAEVRLREAPADRSNADREGVDKLTKLLPVVLVGLLTTSSSMVGAAIGLYAPLSKRVLACILAFAAGSLISALAIELAFKGAMELHHQGFDARSAWVFIAGGFACGAIVYFAASLFLEKKGAAVRRPTQFREYALARKHEQTKELIGLLAKCDLLRHLPAEAIEQILPSVRRRRLDAGRGGVSRGGSRRCAVHRRTGIGGSRRGLARRRRKATARPSPSSDPARRSERWD